MITCVIGMDITIILHEVKCIDMHIIINRDMKRLFIYTGIYYNQ